MSYFIHLVCVFLYKRFLALFPIPNNPLNLESANSSASTFCIVLWPVGLWWRAVHSLLVYSLVFLYIICLQLFWWLGLCALGVGVLVSTPALSVGTGVRSGWVSGIVIPWAQRWLVTQDALERCKICWQMFKGFLCIFIELNKSCSGCLHIKAIGNI